MLMTWQYALQAAVKEAQTLKAALSKANTEINALARNVRDLEDLYTDALEQVESKEEEVKEAHAVKLELQSKQKQLMRILGDLLLPSHGSSGRTTATAASVVNIKNSSSCRDTKWRLFMSNLQLDEGRKRVQ